MTDYFALLDQPRQPWLDPEKLKEAFHAKTRQTHPDLQTGSGAEGAFTQINEAYQVLLDPKRRLHHLLGLEGQPPSPAGGEVPKEIADMFTSVAMATQEAEGILSKTTAATSPLPRSLLRPEVLRARGEIDATLKRLQHLRLAAEEELKAANEAVGGDRLPKLQGLYVRFSYLTRWISQLKEKQTQLSL